MTNSAAVNNAMHVLKGHEAFTKVPAGLMPSSDSIPSSFDATAFQVQQYLGLFERWCKELTTDNKTNFVDQCLPPVDIIMVWHAYLLNPARYSEDSLRNEHIKILAGAGDWFKDLKTRIPYDPFESAIVLTNREIVCHQCLTKANVRLVDSNDTGYLQPYFKTTCPGCGLMITKEKLGFHKLVKDLVGTNDVLAGTLHTSDNIGNSHRAKVIKTEILQTSPRVFAKGDAKTQEEWVVNIQKLFQIVSAYKDDKMFSLDLAGAHPYIMKVLRQGAFVDKMCKLGWTEPDFFSSSEDEVALKHCTARYHAFLDLMSSSPTGFFVPTLDIDLAWHTHQLMAHHDDKVAEDKLSNAFDITCRAWQNRFGISYTRCGCPPPGDTVGQRLSKLISIYKRSGTSSHVVPPRDRSDLLAATHPSDHNAVYLSKDKEQVDAQRRARQAKRQRRIRRDEEKGIRRNGVDHDPAFLVTVPLYCDTECIATTGRVLGRGGGVRGSTTNLTAFVRKGVDNRGGFDRGAALNNCVQTLFQVGGGYADNSGGAWCGGGGSSGCGGDGGGDGGSGGGGCGGGD
ncbi:hypothetical protein EDD18DRAFT_1102741 [Armillaria luteobubalina]|uniref:Uncharacterized protein n=1 Tax=Armillaria luteobubalina TaxID=153913 RepID=A0AA39QD81_9AGAR|nr:hypothetical protein EDD18DRAFT_1102741 [Armillaria luteobubalina]